MISFTGTGIHRIIIEQNPLGSSTSNTALDFLMFPTPVAVPEPAGAVLVVTYMVAACGVWRRR
jgi:hypothetical protein